MAAKWLKRMPAELGTPRLVILAVALALGACAERATVTGPLPVAIGGRTFALELALTPQQRYQGLSDRAHIPDDGGMLFVFPDDQVRVQRFVMRRCLVPIDIIYLDPGQRIVAMHAMQVEPYDTPEGRLTPYSSRYPAQFVIELAGGTLAELDLSEGERIALPAERLKAAAQ
jgi:uncharacterized membrane protein (UPF0127 family)